MLNIPEYVESRGIQVIRDDGSELACYCPFHSNSDTPAFYINKNTGLWICFNPSCGKTGSLRDLMKFFGDNGKIVKEYTPDEIERNLMEYSSEKEEADLWSDLIDEIRIDVDEDSPALKYLLDRGFTKETISFFDIGYSENRRRIVIPARNYDFKIVGIIGRSLDPDAKPKYLYSKGFPRKDLLFNLNVAKKYDSCIVVEGSLDAIKVYQAGFPNVVASLGASITEGHIGLLRRFFDTIIIFSDNDAAGYTMRDEIASHCRDLNLRIVEFANPDVKDPGEMTHDEIRQHIENAADYTSWSFREMLENM